MDIPTTLRTWRKAAKMTQGDLGEKLGVTAPHVSLLEKGKRRASFSLARDLEELTDGLIPVGAWARKRDERASAE